MNEDSFSVQMVGRDGVLFEGEVKAISTQNRVGKYDVLPIHANFISLVNGPVLIYKKDGTTQQINVIDGVIRVVEGRAQVFVGVKAAGESNQVLTAPEDSLTV